MIQRYKNELLILSSILLLIISIIYKQYSVSKFEDAIKKTKVSIQQIKESKRLKALWYPKQMKSKLNRLKRVVPPTKISKFSIKSKKVNIKLSNLKSRELNIFMNELAKLPVRIASLHIEKRANGYGLECLCKW